MAVTAKLLRLYRVDQQIRGLRSRLDAAERYLRSQDHQLSEIDKSLKTLKAQAQKLEAEAANDENEMKAAEQRIAMLRERMNKAQTSKEHSAILTEINTLKADKGLVETRALESMTKVDEIREQVAQKNAEHAERSKVRGVALTDRDARAAEIKDRLAELEGERKAALAEVPGDALASYNELMDLGIEDIMAAVEEIDRKRMEYNCGACYTMLPAEHVNVVLRRVEYTQCPNCKAILYMADEMREAIQNKGKKASKSA
ncbi:MAG: hypothetical protein H6812_08830 [Phycisphaeraceae bacterium]|nr:hypothetical protein [Phycisphaerales bacterium]MCB9843345.1 hypothetical protein [Phycisphaeraceae bacterium]